MPNAKWNNALKLQCDWLAISQQFTEPMPPIVGDGVTIKEDPRRGQIITPHGLDLRGEKGGSLKVRCVNSRLSISGNPSHWESPDNVFGIDTESAVALYQKLAKEMTGQEFGPEARVSRLDAAWNASTGGPEQKRQLLLAMQAREYPRLVKQVIGTSTTFGHGSGSRKARVYDKAQEYEAQHSREPGYDQALADWCEQEGLVRFEMQWMRSLKKRMLQHFRMLTNDKVEFMFKKDMKGIMPNEKEIEFEKAVKELPVKTRLVFGAWRSGENVFELMSQSTWYHHRKVILEKLGIDIKSKTVVALPPAKLAQPVKLSELAKPAWYKG